jgi:phosphoglycerate kinase
MANTFLLAQDVEIGTSLAEPDLRQEARTLLQKAADRAITIHLPADVVVAASIDAETGRNVPVKEIPSDVSIFDIGPATQGAYAGAISQAKTIFWNGPMGVFERPPFAAGTKAVALAVANADATSVVGGGDSVAALEDLGLADRITHVSTGGGASLEFVEGKELPGVAIIPDASNG